jgi:organic hydroperoxide reductase OsmC/OhrA
MQAHRRVGRGRLTCIQELTMSETEVLGITLTQEADFAFRITFDDPGMPALHTDEPAPLGSGSGPNPSRLLLAAVANCLGASLLFALRKYKNTPGTLVAHAKAYLGRNEQQRLRVTRIEVTIDLPEAVGDYAHAERLLGQFEDFCVVTESVRSGIEVDVSVRDASGAIVHHGPAA